MSRHDIVHVEIPAQDLSTTGAFYAELFGWSVAPMEGFDYTTFAIEGGGGGGFPQADGVTATAGQQLIYVDTDDIEASLAQAASLGGTPIVPKTEIPGIGWFGIFADPTGNHIALFTGPDAE